MDRVENSMPSPENPICIIGIGATTSVGLTAESTAAAVRAGIDGFQEHPQLINREGDPYVLAMASFVDASLSGSARFLAISDPAIRQALEPLSKLAPQRCQVPAVVALPEKRPGLPEHLARDIEEHMTVLGAGHVLIGQTRSAFKGHALGLMAIETAGKLISDEQCEFCLVGGIDSYIDPDTLDWLEENDQLHISSNAWGFIPGEAASFALVCSVASARKYKLPVKGQIVSVASAIESNCIKTETVCIGEGLTKAVREVVSVLPNNIPIDCTICDQNGEAYRADEFGFMLCRLTEYFSDSAGYIAPADCWGDVGSASGILYMNLAIAAAEKKYGYGPYSLLWASSESGERSATILKTS